MPHSSDAAAIVLRQQQLHQQQQQQQQQQQHQSPQQLQQHQFGLVRSSKDFMAATANTSTSNASVIQETGFVQERYSYHNSSNSNNGNGNHHQLQDSSHLPPSPLMLNPTIVPSQASQLQQEMHPHLVHPYSHELQRHQQQQQQQHTLQHHRSVYLMQQQYHQQVQRQLQQDQQDLEEATARGRAGMIEMGFQRKRSLSVPLLLTLNPEGLENDDHVHSEHAHPQGQDLDGDQDMDTDDLTSSSTTGVSQDPNSSINNSNNNSDQSTSTALVYDYSKMTLQRESLLATLPRSHRHRAYASSIAKGSHQPSSHSRLYYSSNHHHPHASFRHQYNPFTNRKFPPYQYWAVSAQRDYHLSTIGVLASPSGSRSALHSSSSTSGSGGGGASGGGGTGDMFLRAALGGSSGGGVNKSVYRSRLPVHLRHITSRNSRRPAICLNAFNVGEGQDEGDIDNTRDKKRHSTSVLPSSITDQRDQGAVFQVTRTSSSPPPSTGSGSTSASPSRANRKRLSDWKRVTALSIDREGDSQRTEMVMRLASSDSSSIMSPTTSLSSSSSTSSSVRGSTSSGRQWLSQRGGLANLFQNNLTISGGNSGSGSGGSGGTSVSNVDRLVEEMTKWSV